MRIISGKFKGISLSSIKSNNTRPTLDRIKESIFSTIESLIDINRKSSIRFVFRKSDQ